MLMFESDYRCLIHPEVREAVNGTMARSPTGSYGDDATTRLAQECLKEHFGDRARVFFVPSGTSANIFALRIAMDSSIEAVVCSRIAHIHADEGGSIEASGHRLILVDADEGRITLPSAKEAFNARDCVRLPNPSVLSISQANELGVVYSADHLAALCELSVQQGFRLHIDGARLALGAQALHFQCLGSGLDGAFGKNSSPIVSLGVSKLGGFGDAVIVFSDADVAKAERLQIQLGYLTARTDITAVQFSALFGETALWRDLASTAHAMAVCLEDKLAAINVYPAHEVQSNAVFVSLDASIIERLAESVVFHVWHKKTGLVRFMCNWSTNQNQCQQLVDKLNELMSSGS